MEAYDFLEKAILWDRVSHAYIINAAQQQAKDLALFLAKGVNCMAEGRKPCGRCSSCRKIDTSNHPDVTIIRDGGASIGIDDIRQLQKEIFLKPYEGKKRVSIILQGEKMTVQAQNCLLKVLEDPPGDGIIAITTANPAGLLPTILSRCQVLKPGTGQNIPDHRLYHETMVCMIKEDFTRASAVIDLLVRDTDRSVEDFLDYMLLQLRDVLVLKVAQKEDLLYIKDNGEFARRTAAEFTTAGLGRMIEAVSRARENLRQNANTQLTLEVLLLDIQEV